MEAVVSIPFIAGQWSLPTISAILALVVAFVSIPFIAGQWSLQSGYGSEHHHRIRFNPLHCGAVVASTGGAGFHLVMPARFNPLHCGAVVASSGGGAR